MAPTSRSSAWHHVRRCRKTGAKARMRAARRAGRRGTAASLGGDGPALPSHPPHHLQVRAGRRTRPQTAKVELLLQAPALRVRAPQAQVDGAAAAPSVAARPLPERAGDLEPGLVEVADAEDRDVLLADEVV